MGPPYGRSPVRTDDPGFDRAPEFRLL